MGIEHLPQGTPFGRYVIQRLLGSGTFGAVYAASHQDLHRKVVALKVLHRHLLHVDEVVRRFQAEAKIIAELKHPNVVDVLDVGRHDGIPYIAMEFLEGETLADRLEREGCLPITGAIELMLPLCSAVMAVHANGIVHRDLKPENVILETSRRGRVQPKLLDFGVAKERIGPGGMTRTGAAMGTPFYMSPEQVEEAKDSDGASDQWGLAVILYRCVTGSLPFQGRSTVAVLHKIVTEPASPPSVLLPDCPPELDAVILRALEKHPRDRFPDVRAFAAALLPLASPRTQEEWSEEFVVEALADPMGSDEPTLAAIRIPPTLLDAEPSIFASASQPSPPTLQLEHFSAPPTTPILAATTEPVAAPEESPPRPSLSTMSLGVRELSTLPEATPARSSWRRSRWVLPVAATITLCLSSAATWTVLHRYGDFLRAPPPSPPVTTVVSPPVVSARPVSPVTGTVPSSPLPRAPERPVVLAPPPAPSVAPSVAASAPSVPARVGVRPGAIPERAAAPPAHTRPRGIRGSALQSWPPLMSPTTPAASVDPSSHTNSGLRVRY